MAELVCKDETKINIFAFYFSQPILLHFGYLNKVTNFFNSKQEAFCVLETENKSNLEL